MNFDYRLATEATFSDWVNEGVAKAQAILASVKIEADDENPENSDK